MPDGAAEMKNEKRDFDRDASSWDQVPQRVQVASDIAHSMSRTLILRPDMDVLDFGCGTGLMSLALQPFVHSVTGVDSSQGMLDVFRRKISDNALQNVKALYLDLEKGDNLSGNYHLVVSSMTLHHIKEFRPLLRQFYHVLRPSGTLCIADLDLDDGQFHASNDGVFYFGFDREDLRLGFHEAGFGDIRAFDAARIEKPVEGSNNRIFTIFLMTGCKE
jgi:ubiquinone/menaquinone biosynthesis C-methylase UbiE